MMEPLIDSDESVVFRRAIKAIQSGSKRGPVTVVINCTDPDRRNVLRALGKAYKVNVELIPAEQIT